MNKDLDRQLDEMGIEYRILVNKMLDAYRQPEMPATTVAVKRCPRWLQRVSWLVAASVVFALAVSAVMRANVGAEVGGDVGRTVAPREYLLAHLRDSCSLDEIIRTQNPDGSWDTDFLTRQNASALKLANGEAARIAYKKAMRNLRNRGVL